MGDQSHSYPSTDVSDQAKCQEQHDCSEMRQLHKYSALEEEHFLKVFWVVIRVFLVKIIDVQDRTGVTNNGK